MSIARLQHKLRRFGELSLADKWRVSKGRFRPSERCAPGCLTGCDRRHAFLVQRLTINNQFLGFVDHGLDHFLVVPVLLRAGPDSRSHAPDAVTPSRIASMNGAVWFVRVLSSRVTL